MTAPSFRDMEQLSANLDGQLSRAERTYLDSRLAATPGLRAALEELRQTRALLRRTPPRRVPRNFTLTPRMAGVRPPMPRAVPALRWTTAVISLLFVCTFTTNLIPRFVFGAAGPAPMLAAPEMAVGGAQSATEAPVTADSGIKLDATSGGVPAPASEATPSVNARTLEQPPVPGQSPKRIAPLLTPIQIGLLVLVILTGGAAVIIPWLNRRAFLRKNKRR